MDIRAVIFDMDGVIFDSERLILECWIRVAQRHGIDDIETACRACIGVNRQAAEETFYRKYGRDFDYAGFRREASELFFGSLENGVLPVKAGVRELLEYLAEKGMPAAIASSTRTDIVTRELKDAGLYGYFRKIIGGDMAARSKPAPDIFLHAAECLGKKPAVCLVIEDSYNGVRAATNAGMHCIMVPDLLPPDEDMYAAADGIMQSLFEVKEFLETQI